MNIDVTSKSKLQSFTDFMILHNIHEIKINMISTFENGNRTFRN